MIVVAGLALTGCRKPITQHPLSLNLPGPVENLTAIRGDNQIWLTWTMPQKTTHKRRIRDDVTVQVCRRAGMAGVCVNAGKPVVLAPGATGSFSEMLPPDLASGTPRALHYFVELKNRDGRSAGLINGVWTLAGRCPFPIQGLTAEMSENSVLLRWAAATSSEEPDGTVIRLYRKPLAVAPSNEMQGPHMPSFQSMEQKLLVETGAASVRAVDNNIRFGETYEYRIQRVAQVIVNGQTLELAGELSLPVRVHAVNVESSSTEPSKRQ
jgi:hypothetical protein